MQINHDIYVKILTNKDIDIYLQAFSLKVQKILHVSSAWYEYDYLYQQLQKPRNELFFYGIFKEQKELIGIIEIRDSHYRGQLYTWINDAWWGKGIFQNAFTQVVKDYFEKKTEEQSITATVDVSNSASYRALLKAGFINKGRINGPYEDQYYMVYEKV